MFPSAYIWLIINQHDCQNHRFHIWFLIKLIDILWTEFLFLRLHPVLFTVTELHRLLTRKVSSSWILISRPTVKLRYQPAADRKEYTNFVQSKTLYVVTLSELRVCMNTFKLYWFVRLFSCRALYETAIY